MSGTKRITVDEQAWHDALQQAARLHDLERDLPRVVEAVRRAQQEQAQRDRDELRARQESLNRSMAEMSSMARKLEEGTTRRIRQTTSLIMSQARASVRAVRNETRQALDEQDRRFGAELEKVREERQEELAGLHEEIAGLRGRGDRALGAAATQVADARVLHDAIAASLPHERYAPGRLDALGRRLTAAEANVAHGLGETALAQAQDLFLSLGELRVAVEIGDAEWRAAHLAALSAVTALVEQIRYNSLIAALGDETSPAEVDVEFWSEGELTALQDEAGRLAARVNADQDPLAAPGLRAIAEHDAAALEQRLTEVVAKARTRQFASQVRVNMAEMVIDALEEATGYTWQGDATYAGEDQRRAFYSKLRHPDQSEIVVEVAPDETGESCVLTIRSYESGVPDESERVHRLRAITDSLRQRGLPTGAPAADSAAPDPALADFGRLRQAGHVTAQQT